MLVDVIIVGATVLTSTPLFIKEPLTISEEGLIADVEHTCVLTFTNSLSEQPNANAEVLLPCASSYLLQKLLGQKLLDVEVASIVW